MPGGGISIELDFGDKAVRNVLEVRTGGTDYRRRVRVEGRDEGQDWSLLVDEAWIYHIPESELFRGAVYDEVVVPDTDYERLKVTVLPMAGEDLPLEIESVRARRRTVRKPETEPLPVASFQTEKDPNTQTSTLEIDFGYRHARPLRVSLDFQEEAFQRSYRALGRNEKKMLQRGGPTEAGEAIEREIEAPWRTLAAGSLLRLPPGRAGEAAIEETAIDLDGEPVRYLRLVIQDRDDPSLRLRGVEAEALVHRIVFPVRPGGRYDLYYGNRDARAPDYDLAALLPDLEAAPPASASLGQRRDNPLYAKGPGLPFSERHPWVLWILLLAAVAALALVVLRNLRAVSASG